MEMKKLIGILIIILITTFSYGQDNIELENNEIVKWKDTGGILRGQIFPVNNTFLVTSMGTGMHLHFGDGRTNTSDTWFSADLNETPSSLVPFVIKATGNIGVGTNFPSNKFEIKSIDNNFSTITLGLQPYQNDNTQGGLGVASGGVISLNAYNNLIFQTDGGNGYSEHMRINAEGKVGIGTTDFSGDHKLRVQGSIGAREIKVEASGWSDFVFEDNYELRTLEETEKFIVKNKHLPEIPSAAEVEQDGINLGEMDAKLLQKLEEMTLYMIDMNKEIKAVKEENAILKEKMKTLEEE